MVTWSLLDQYEPEVLILVAGADPMMRPLQCQMWETFSVIWHRGTRWELGCSSAPGIACNRATADLLVSSPLLDSDYRLLKPVHANSPARASAVARQSKRLRHPPRRPPWGVGVLECRLA
jgi:hypothetical protein